MNFIKKYIYIYVILPPTDTQDLHKILRSYLTKINIRYQQRYLEIQTMKQKSNIKLLWRKEQQSSALQYRLSFSLSAELQLLYVLHTLRMNMINFIIHVTRELFILHPEGHVWVCVTIVLNSIYRHLACVIFLLKTGPGIIIKMGNRKRPQIHVTIIVLSSKLAMKFLLYSQIIYYFYSVFTVLIINIRRSHLSKPMLI